MKLSHRIAIGFGAATTMVLVGCGGSTSSSYRVGSKTIQAVPYYQVTEGTEASTAWYGQFIYHTNNKSYFEPYTRTYFWQGTDGKWESGPSAPNNFVFNIEDTKFVNLNNSNAPWVPEETNFFADANEEFDVSSNYDDVEFDVTTLSVDDTSSDSYDDYEVEASDSSTSWAPAPVVSSVSTSTTSDVDSSTATESTTTSVSTSTVSTSTPAPAPKNIVASTTNDDINPNEAVYADGEAYVPNTFSLDFGTSKTAVTTTPDSTTTSSATVTTAKTAKNAKPFGWWQAIDTAATAFGIDDSNAGEAFATVPTSTDND